MALTAIEKVIFLKELPLFQQLSLEQLLLVAAHCDEERHPEGTYVFQTGDQGGALYIIVNGIISIEKEQRHQTVQMATLGNGAYFGETTLLTETEYDTNARAIQNAHLVKLSGKPIMALGRQYPDLPLKLINALSAKLRMLTKDIAEHTRARPNQIHRLLDRM